MNKSKKVMTNVRKKRYTMIHNGISLVRKVINQAGSEFLLSASHWLECLRSTNSALNNSVMKVLLSGRGKLSLPKITQLIVVKEKQS